MAKQSGGKPQIDEDFMKRDYFTGLAREETGNAIGDGETGNRNTG